MVQYPAVNNNADLEFLLTPQCKVIKAVPRRRRQCGTSLRKFFSKNLSIVKHIHIAQTYLINRLSLYIINLDEYTQSKRFY